jgi:hypothetical protein
MTMQNNRSSGSSYFSSMTGQLVAFGVVTIVLIVLAVMYVF